MDFEFKDFYDIADLKRIMEILCDKDIGCEWDKVQNHQSIRQNFIEETYEAVDAIDKDDKELMKEELGDVLLQVVYHAYFEQCQGNFDLYDVIDGVCQKLVLRHPHVFKGEKTDSADDALKKWEQVKNQSHGHTTITQTLDAVPKTFPALMYAQKIQKRVSAGGASVPSIKDEIQNIRTILDNIEKSVDQKASEKDMSELLFSAVNITRQSKLDSEEILSKKSMNFVKIFSEFEKIALQNNLKFGRIDNADLKKIWEQAEDACE